MKNKTKRVIALILAAFLCLEIYPLPLRNVMAQGTVGTASESDATSETDESQVPGSEGMITGKVQQKLEAGETPEGILPESAGISDDKMSAGQVTDATDGDADVAFEAETECDGVKIKVSADAGVFPEDATMKAVKISDEKAQAEGIPDAVNDLIDENKVVAEAYTFDISIYDKEGKEIEPDNSKGEVRVSFDAALVKDTNFETDVYHIKDEAGNNSIDKLDVSEKGSVAEVVTDGFSYYYVTFTYNSKTFKLERGVEAMLEEITSTLGYTGHPILDEISDTSILESRVEPGYGDAPDDYYIKAKPDYDPSAGATATVKFHMDGNDTYIYIDITVCTDIAQTESGSGVMYLVTNKNSTAGGQGAFDVRGGSGGNVQTTYSSSRTDGQGYVTVMQVDGTTMDLAKTSPFSFGKVYSIGDISLYLTARIDDSGNAVLITYTFDNNGTTDKEASVGSAADIQIGTNDNAPIEILSNGVRMKDQNTGKVFLLMPVNGNFTTRWFGGYSYAVGNVFNSSTQQSLSGTDSGVAWSWTVTVPAGGTVSRTAKLIAGDYTTATVKFDANGGEGTMDDLIVITNAPTTLTMNTFTKEGYRFMGWSTDPNATPEQRQYKDGHNIIVTEDKTLYAIWAPKKTQEISVPSSNITMTYGDPAVGIGAGVFDPDDASGPDTAYLGDLSYEVEDSDIVSVDADGKITALKSGTTTVTVKAEETIVYKPASKVINVTVKKRNIALKANTSTKVYGEEDALNNMYSPADGYTLITGDTIENSFTESVSTASRTAGENVGDYTVTGAGLESEKYNILSVTPGKLTITPRPITVAAVAKTKVYGQPDPELTLELLDGTSYADWDEESDVYTGELKRVSGEAVGTYRINKNTLAANRNYTMTFMIDNARSLTITPKDVIVKANDASKLVNNQDPALSAIVMGVLESDPLSCISYNVTRAEGETAGTYTITPSGEASQGNYSVTYQTGTFTISRNPNSGSVTMDDWVYRGTAKDPVLTAEHNGDSASYTYFIDEDCTRVTTTDYGAIGYGAKPTYAGTYYVKANIPATVEYMGVSTAPDPFTIEKSSIKVKVNDKSSVYGETLKRFDCTVESTNEGGYDISELNPVYTSDVTTNPVVGTYEIELSIPQNRNYNIEEIKNGTYTISKRAIKISLNRHTKYYGDPDPKYTYIVDENTPLADGDNIEDIITGEPEREEGETIGEYVVSRGTVDSDNYDITFVDGVLEILKRPITIIAEDKEKTFNEKDPELTYIISKDTPLAEGDSLEDVVSFKLLRESGEKVGTYAIKADEIESEYYDVTFKEGTFTIKKVESGATAGVTSDDDSDKDVRMTTPGEDLLDMLLTEEDRKLIEEGAGVSIYFEITHLDQLSADEETIIKKALADGYVIGDNYDISLFKKYSFEPESEQLFETPEAVNFELDSKLPDIPAGATREYAVVRVHDGVAEVIPSTYDSEKNTVQFASDKFSTYSIAYKDSLSSKDSADGKSDASNKKIAGVKTGDMINMSLILTLITLSILGITLTVYKKKKYLMI